MNINVIVSFYSKILNGNLVQFIQPQQKQIRIIALAVLTTFATCLMIYRRGFFHSKKITIHKTKQDEDGLNFNSTTSHVSQNLILNNSQSSLNKKKTMSEVPSEGELPKHKNDDQDTVTILKENKEEKHVNKEEKIETEPAGSDPEDEECEECSETESNYSEDFDPDLLDEMLEKSNESSSSTRTDDNKVDDNGDKYVIKIGDKLVSRRTLNCLKKLESVLAPLGKTYKSAVDNGDCFFDSFAQGLSVILKRKVTVKELRQKVSDYIIQLDRGPVDKNWVKDFFKKEFCAVDNYETYIKRIGYTHQETLDNDWPAPIWGELRREGVILCRLYKVNLKVYEVGYTDEDINKMNDLDNYWDSDPSLYPKNEKYDQTIEMALYPGHFMPIFDKQDGDQSS